MMENKKFTFMMNHSDVVAIEITSIEKKGKKKTPKEKEIFKLGEDFEIENYLISFLEMQYDHRAKFLKKEDFEKLRKFIDELDFTLTKKEFECYTELPF